jgi:hypothetical protein
MTSTGQNRSCTARPSQNPLSDFKSPIREILRLLGRIPNSPARGIPHRWYTRTLSRTFSDTIAYLPLCRHQVPGIRAGSTYSNPFPRLRNTYTSISIWLDSGHVLRLLHLPTRSNPRPLSLRDESEPPQHAIRNLQTHIR